MITSDALKIKPTTVVKHYWAWFDFSQDHRSLASRKPNRFDFWLCLALEYFLFKFIYAHCGKCTVQDQNCLHFIPFLLLIVCYLLKFEYSKLAQKIFQFSMTLLKVIKPQKQSFLKLHCPENKQNIRQNSAPRNYNKGTSEKV